MATLPLIEQTLSGPRAQGSSPELLVALLGTLEEEASAAGAPTKGGFAPGLPSGEVERQLAAVGLAPPEELSAWFAWHDGANESSAAHRLIPGLVVASLADCVRSYRELVLDFDPPPDPLTGTPLDPKFFTMGVGEGWLRIGMDNFSIAMDCSGQLPSPPLVRLPTWEHYDPGFEGKLQAVSLCTVVTWWIESIRSGAYRWNTERQLWDDSPLDFPESRRAVYFY